MPRHEFDDFQPDVSPKMPADKRRGIGIVGCGSITAHAHLPAYRKYGLNVVALASRREAAVAQLAEQFEVPQWFTDFRRLLDRPEVEVVDVTVAPDEARVEIVREACARGKHVLMQKPFAHSLDAAREMVALAERAGVLLAVNQNARWCPQYRAARLAIEAGLIGRPTVLTHHLRGGQDGAPWFHEREYATRSRFQLIEYSVHHLDLMRFWIAREPDRVQATIVRRAEQRAPGEMTVSIQLTFGDDALAIVTDDNAAPPSGAPYGSRFHIEGTTGTIAGEATSDPYLRVWSPAMPEPWQLPPTPIAWFPDGFAGTMGELLCALEQGRPVSISGQDNLNTLKIVFDAYADAEKCA